MAVHPIEYRYSTPEMRVIFEQENILDKRLQVEAAVSRAHAKVGNIPQEAAETISKKANSKDVKIERVKEIEKETQHDLMALVKALTEQCGDAGRYIHLGVTSYDIVDTSWALLLKEALEVLEKSAREFQKILLDKCKECKDVVVVGRTHGQQAVPMTMGLKFAVWIAEMDRNLKRIQEAKEMISVGKMTGAVGTGAALGPKMLEIQELVMKDLGLDTPYATTQVIQRDRHAEVIFHLALIAQTLEKIAKEIRNLQRTEIAEVREAFGKKQVGSSTMPQKRNPWKSERVCGLARVIRGNVAPAMENITLEHERDLTNSSNERVIFPETFILTDFILREMIKIVDGLELDEKNIKKNLDLSGGLLLAEAVMIKLSEKGMGRQDAHEVIRSTAMEAYQTGKSFSELLKGNKEISGVLSEQEIEDTLKPENYIGKAKEQVDRVLNSFKV